MPELPDHTPGRFDDELTSQLSALAHDAAQQSRTLTAPEIRSRAARRRSGQVAAVAAVTVAVVVGVGWSLSAGADRQGREPLQPIGPSQTTSSTPTSPAETTQTPRAGLATTPPDPPTLPAQPAAVAPGPTPAGGWVTTIPAGLTLPFEGVKSSSSDASDWKPLAVDTWLLTPCSRAERDGYPSDDTRTDLRTIGSHMVEHADSEQLAAYSSDVGAIAAMAELRQAVVGCSAVRTIDRKAGTYHDSYWNFADAVDLMSTSAGQHPNEAFVAWKWNRTYDLKGNPQYGLGGGLFLVTRVGNAIFLTVSDGETNYGEPGAAERESVKYAENTRLFLPTMCAAFADGNGC